MLNVKAVVALMNAYSNLKFQIGSEYLWFKLRLGLKQDSTFKEVVQAVKARMKARLSEFWNTTKG